MRPARSLSSATVVAVIVLIGGWSNVTWQYLGLRRSTLKCFQDRLVPIVLMSNSFGGLDHTTFASRHAAREGGSSVPALHVALFCVPGMFPGPRLRPRLLA